MAWDQSVSDWLLAGDISIVYQAKRDLLPAAEPELQQLQVRIPLEGWGQKLLDARRPDGHWGRCYYSPKWTSTHYSLLDLRLLCPPRDNRPCRETLSMLLSECIAKDGGVNYAKTVPDSDVCIAGMVLNMACYFGMEQTLLTTLVDFLFRTSLPIGGWNCAHTKGHQHFSAHITISVLEGLLSYLQWGYTYRHADIGALVAAGEEQFLIHHLYQSHTSGEPMDVRMTKLSYPPRWHSDILRVLDYFRAAGRPYDPRMDDALRILRTKRHRDGRWPLQANHPGQVHVAMEAPGKASRWNTLRALRVLVHFKNRHLCFDNPELADQ